MGKPGQTNKIITGCIRIDPLNIFINNSDSQSDYLNNNHENKDENSLANTEFLISTTRQSIINIIITFPNRKISQKNNKKEALINFHKIKSFPF